MNKELVLTDIADIDHWQKIQDHFGQVLGITIRTVDRAGNSVTQTSNPTRLCQEIISNSVLGINRCDKCLPVSLDDLIAGERWKDGYQCHLGLYNFCIPVIAFDNHAIAYMLIGPVLLGHRRETEKYKHKIKELNINPEGFIDSIVEIKLSSYTEIQSILELISNITCHIAYLGYSRLKLEEIIPLSKVGRIINKYYIDKILSALLDVSFITTNAEFGSIMLLDETTGELYIKIAKGLKKEIIKESRLKIGEGIAGLAIQEGNPFLLNDEITNQAIKSRFKRPEIKSAAVVPLQVKNKPYGVINMGTSRTSGNINLESLKVIHRLIELTEASLESLFNL